VNVTKSISTEAALKHVIELRDKYKGPDRDSYVAEIDCFLNEFRKEHGPQIELETALQLLRDLELRFGPQ
jgi:hypothetical protein